MFLGGRGADPESRTNFLVRRTRGDERDDLALTGRQPVAPRRSSRTKRRLTLAQPSAKYFATERRLSAQRAKQRAAQAVGRTVRVDVTERSRPKRIVCVRWVRVLGHDDRWPGTAEIADLFPREALVGHVED